MQAFLSFDRLNIGDHLLTLAKWFGKPFVVIVFNNTLHCEVSFRNLSKTFIRKPFENICFGNLLKTPSTKTLRILSEETILNLFRKPFYSNRHSLKETCYPILWGNLLKTSCIKGNPASFK